MGTIWGRGSLFPDLCSGKSLPKSEWMHICSGLHHDKCQTIIKTSTKPPQRKWRNRLCGGVHSYYLKRRSIRLNGLLLQTYMYRLGRRMTRRVRCKEFVPCDCFFSKVYILFDTIMYDESCAVFFLIFHINPSMVFGEYGACHHRTFCRVVHSVYSILCVQYVTYWSGFNRHILWVWPQERFHVFVLLVWHVCANGTLQNM